MTTEPTAFDDITFTARDGLKLYARHYAARPTARRRGASKPRPVVCLAGLTRNGRDFHATATSLSQDATLPRDVYTLDMRGRGGSEFDPNWKNYAIPIEAHDVVDFMTMRELFDCAVIGTSRGGLIALVLAAMQPGRMGALVLNDIGPVIETSGLSRIAGYVGRMPTPKSWQDATTIVTELTRRDFPKLTDDELAGFAHQLFNDVNGRPTASYDAKLAKTLSAFDGPIPVLWPQFESLTAIPVMAIRGGNSDLLSEQTVDEMQRRHPRLTRLTVPDQGHAPLLNDQPTIAAISDFLARSDGSKRLSTTNAA